MAAISLGGAITLELTRPCPNSGTYDNARQVTKTEFCRVGRINKITGIEIVETDEDCGTCRGTGEVLTYEGEQIVDIVRVWLREDPKPE